MTTLPRSYIYCARLHVIQPWRGSGVMQQLARECFRQFAVRGTTVAICHCYQPLVRLYQRMGFHPYGQAFLLPGLEQLGFQTPMRCEADVWQVPQAA